MGYRPRQGNGGAPDTIASTLVVVLLLFSTIGSPTKVSGPGK